jgi:Holliday junction resolvase RusA-like endonuclease
MKRGAEPARERGPWPKGTELTFYVGGVEPVAKGSMRAFVPKGWNRAVVTDSGGARLRSYESAIRNAARAEMDKRGLPCAHETPFEVLLAFFTARPAKDYDRHGIVRGAARATPWLKPDIDKLQRSTLDALTGLVFDDDSRIVRIVVEKRFADANHDIGTWVKVRTLPRTAAELRDFDRAMQLSIEQQGATT